MYVKRYVPTEVKASDSSGTGGMGDAKPPDTDAGTWTQNLPRSSKPL